MSLFSRPGTESLRALPRIRAAVFALVCALVLSACGGDESDSDSKAAGGDGKETLEVAIDPTFRPLAFKTEEGDLDGFDFDLANQVAERMGLEPSFTEMAFDGIIPAINAGNADTNVDLAITEERQEQVDFTEPYVMQSNIAVTRSEDSDLNPDIEELEQLQVGVISGTSADQLLQLEAPNVSPVRFNQVPDAFRDLRLGRIDAVVINNLTAGYYVSNIYPGEFRLSERAISDETIGVGAAVAKGNTELVDKMNAAFDEMREDGSLLQLIEDWFGPDVAKDFAN